MKTILLLDDQLSILNDLEKFLGLKGKELVVYKANSIPEAEKIIKSERLNYAIIDLKVDETSEYGGLQVINYIKKMQPNVKVIVLSGNLTDEIKSQLKVEIDGCIEKGGEQNYILSVWEKLNELDRIHVSKSCYVIMPFSDSKSCTTEQWTEIFNKLIKPAIEESGHNYICKRSDAIYGNIIEQILDQLNRSDLVIADLTDRNSNVFYELGVRHALRDSTILIAQNLDDIPFDLRPYAIQCYDWKLEKDREIFKNRMKEIIEVIENDKQKASSPVQKYLEL